MWLRLLLYFFGNGKNFVKVWFYILKKITDLPKSFSVRVNFSFLHTSVWKSEKFTDMQNFPSNQSRVNFCGKKLVWRIFLKHNICTRPKNIASNNLASYLWALWWSKFLWNCILVYLFFVHSKCNTCSIFFFQRSWVSQDYKGQNDA